MATVLLAVLLVGGEALAQTETEPWSATLTRGDGVAASSGNYGYVAATETGPGGMLDPSTFTYAGVLYTVKRLYVTDLGPFDAVAFETSPALPNDAGLVLRVPTFKTDDVSEACPIVLEYQDFEIHSPDMSNPGLFSWPVSFTSCLTSENWAADLTTTGTVKLIKLIKPPAVTLVLSDASIGENGGVSTVTATVSPASAAAFTVTVAAAAVAPAVAADFELSTNRVLSFAENATTSTGTVTITGVDNDVYAADKTVTVSGTVSATSVTAPANRTLTLEDDDLPTVGISNSRGDEHYVPGVAGVAIGPYVEMSAVSDKIVIVTWTASIESGDTAEEADFVDLSAVTGTVWLVPGWKVHAFNLPPVVFDDALDEEDETFTVTLSAVNAVVGQVNASVHSAGTMTIVDDDPTPTVTVADAAATEGDKVEFVVTLSAVSGRDVTVDYATSVATGDDATSGTDFTAVSSGTLTIAAADNTATGTIEVQTTEDDASESAETFTLTISNPDNATLTTDTTATGTIEDDDGTSTTDPVWSTTMTAGDTRVGHGYDATDTPDTPAIGALDDDDFNYGSLPYRVLAIDVATNVVRFAVEPGGQLADETLTLEIGGHALAFSDRLSAISIGQNIYWNVPAALDDLETEFPVGSTATVCLRTATQVCPAGSIVTPPAAGVTVSATALTVTEQDTAGDSYTVVLDTEPTHDVTVTVGGHAGTDVSLSSSTLTFTPSNWDRAQTVTVTALNDDDTADDAVTLTHAATSTDGNYSGITIAGVAVTVTDNDTTTPAVTLVLSDASIGENGGVSTVTATVSPASAAAFTVTVVAAAVSPAVAADFRLSANQVLSFAENATTSTGTVTITGVDNDVDAADKTVTVSATVSATSVTAPATRTLTLNDDDLPVVTIARDKNVVNEDEGDAGFTLTRVGLTAATLAVTVEVTQQADRDLLPDGAEAMRTVTFAAGSATAALAVALENDNLQEVLGGVTVEVQPGTAYTVGAPASATVTVVDTDNTTATPANLVASPGMGPGEVVLSWNAHALHARFVRHQYRYKTDGGYEGWTDIPNSGQHDTPTGEDGSNLTGYTVTGLVGEQAHTFEVRTVGLFSKTSDSSNEDSATPRSAAVSFEAATYSVDEGATVEVTVSLSGAPGREVTVAVTATAAGGATAQGETGADWSGVPESVTFGATDTEQSFTLAATQDMVDDDSEGVVLSFGTLPDGVTAGTLSGATVTITDDDAAGVRVSATALTVTEQDTTGDSYTVVLDTEPTHAVTVTVGGHSGTDVSLSSSTLTFTTSNWDRAQTVTVTALNDDDTADDAVTLTHTATSTDGNYSGIAIAGVAVTVTDNDTTTPTVTLVLSDASIGENGGVSTVTATVSPASAAAFTVTVAAAAVSPAVAADFRLSANPVLSFAENATTSTGEVTITGVDDDVDAADKTVTVSGTVSATSVTAPATRTLTLEDDDAAGVTVSATALTVTEQDTAGDSYTVVLDTEPTHDVTVTVGGHAGTDVSLSSSTLIFTPSNWDRAQTVTVTALNDDDTADDAVTLTHAATSTDGNYSGIAIAGVAVTVTDNDTTTPTVTLVLSDASIGENGGVSTVTATVSPASAAAFTVTVAAAAVSPAVAADFRLSANPVLSFAENATTSTGEVTITGVDDDVDAADKTVTVSGTVSATSVTAPATRTLTLEDDDAAGVTVSATALTVTEEDTAGDSYTVVLDTEPTHDVTVTVGGHAGTDVSLSSSTLIFTPSNWDRAQTVTVTALNDDDTADDAVTLTHAATSTDGNYSGIAIAGVAVTVTDNDTTTPAVTLVLSDASIGENGGVSTVTATVSPASAAAFTVTVAAAAVSPAVAADFRLSANPVLSFAENATTSTGEVTITGVDDDVDAADKTVTVSGTVSATSVTAPATRTLTLEDDDAAGVTVSATALTVTEQDTAGDSYTVVLDTEPTHDVTVTVGGHAGTDVSLSSSTLIFTPSNWDRAQTVTVTALNDDDTADDAVTLTHAATSTDGNYSGIAIAGVAVTVTDNDTTTPTVTLVLSDASIGENGGVSTVTATVSPASAAAFTVTVAAAAVSPAVAADFRLSANPVLSFAENATASTGSVTITGVDNDVDAADKTVTVSATVSATGVTAPVNRTLTLEDDDTAGVTVSATALTVTEQDAAGDSYTVVLDTEPTHGVTVAVGGHAGTDVSLSSSTLIFTPSNWDRAQTVTVTALNDDDTANDAVTLTHTATSTDANYSGIAIAAVAVTVTDNDTTTPTVTLVLSADSIGENGGVSTVTATVSPASAAAFTVTVAAAAVSPAVAADFRLSANQVLSFAENATTSTGSVTITGVDDDVDAADKTVTVSGTVSATGVTAPANLTLTLEDDDTAGVRVSATALTVTEQDTTGDSYTVVLDTEPTHDVTVTVGGHAGTDVSLSSSTLTFTTSNWDRAQTVTVTALNDDDTADDAVTLTHAATSTDGNYSGIAIAGVAVTVTDNDTTTPTVTLVLSDASIGENGGVSTVTATVSPASAAAFTVTVAAAAVSPAVAADFRLSANPVLSFAENATTSTGEVTITGVDDDVDAADKTVTVSGTVSATSVTAPATRTLTLEDDDAAGVTVSATALTVTEEDTAGDSYTVVLDTEPTHDVTVTVGGHAGTDVSLSASTLTFTTSNWDRAQTVTVTALNDDDTADDAVTLTHTAASTDGNYSGITIAGVAVTVTDNDTTTPAVTLVLSDGSIGENGGVSTVTATVSPASAAAFTVTVAAAAVSPATADDFELSTNRVLSFAENATTSTGSVTITGVDNDVDAADKTVTVSGTVSATSVTAPANRTLTLEDDDAAGVRVSATALTVTEQDTTGDSYTLVLDTEPTHAVTVTVGGHSGTDVSLSSSTLTFTTSNWDQAQTVTVTALNDDDTADDAVTLTHTAASTDGNYSGITIAGVAVTVTDNDTTTPAVTLVLSDGSIGENGGVSTVTATVSPASAAAFTVTVAAAAVSPATADDFELSTNRVLSFAENATTSTGSVTITGVDNDVDAADKTVTVSGTVSAAGVTAPANRTLTLEDDDAAGVRVSATALTVTEQDTTGDSYTLVLDTEPTHAVTVTVGGHSGTDVSLSSSTLTFTTSNWDQAQTVTVTALNDDDTADDAVTLTHTAASTDGNYSGITIAGVAVTVTDNDTTTPAVTLVLSDGSIGENGGVSTVTATVSPASATAFTVTISAAAVSPAVAADFRLSANRVLSFAENATTSAGTVTITGVDNDVDAADKTVTVSGTVSAAGVTAPANRTLTLEDDDAAGVTVSVAALTVTEQDTAGDSYTVVLDTEPTHDVTVTVGGHAGTDVSLSASTLTFTTSNWDRAQTVTVTALNDDDTADDAVTLTHTATSTDGNYGGITIAGVAVTVTDNDTTTPAVILVLSAASIGEDGGVSTVTATVSPASATAFTVTISAAAVSPAVAADFRLSANRVLSFAENATTSAGTVTITGVDNDVDAADKTVTVSGTVSAAGVTAPANRTLTLEDDDAAGVTVSATALTVTEQDTTGDSYTVVLDTEPTHAVTVTVGGHSGTDVSLSSSTLTFTPSNWDQAQTVTVTALNDDDTADDAVTLTHTAASTDGNYSGITIAGVAVTVTDNDTTTPAVTLVLSDGSIGENGGVSTVTATVSPASATAFTVTISAAAVSPAVAADFRLSANRVLSFAENATTSAGTVTITGVDNDVDAADKTVTVSGTVSAAGVTAPANRTLTLEDDDAAGVTVSATALTVTEQDTAGDSYTVVLDTEPTHEVTVTVGGHSGTDVSLSASTLTFTTSNWDQAQTVTVTALNDDDTANDAVTLTHTATSTDGNYGGITIAGVAVTVTDNDTTTPAVTLVLSADSIGEDGGVSTVTATVSPASAVPFTVTVSASPVAPATEDDFTLSTNRVLSFAASETESTGTVRIRPVDDDDPEPDLVVRVSGAVSNAAISHPDDVTLTIIDDDSEPFDVAVAAPAAVDEDAGTATVTVTLTTRQNSAPVVSEELYYYWRQETATRGEDYRPPPGEDFVSNVLFATVPTSAFSPNAAGTAWVAQHAFTIGIVDDQEGETDETIVFQIYSQNNNTGSPTQTITIRDDDASAAVSIAAANPTVVEEQPAVFTLIRTGATGSSLTVTVALSEQADRDLLPDGAATERTARFARGSSTATLMVELQNDHFAEPDGDLTAAVQAGAGYTVGDPSTATVTVEDGDTGIAPPTVTSVAVASAPQSGNAYHWGETIVFTVTFNEPVRVTGGPGLEVGLDDPAGASGSTVQARFAGLSESERPTVDAEPVPVSRHVHFAYTVQAFDRDADGVRIAAAALRLASGDRIRSDATGANAEFDHAALGPQSGHRVDGRTTVDGEPAAPVAGAGIWFVDTNGNNLETQADGNHRLWVPEGGSARYGLRLATRPARTVVVSHHPLAGDPDLDVPWNFASDRSIAPNEWDTKTVWVRVVAAQDGDAENGERVFENRAFSNDPNYHDLALLDVIAVEADDEPPCTLNPGDIWCGVVTVGIQRVPSGDDSYGFSPYFGQLSDDSGDRSFTYGTNTYTIGNLVREGGGGEGVLLIRLTSHLAEADRAKLVLHIGSASFAFSDATVATDANSSDETYLWGSDLDWSRQSYVILRLREASSAQRALQGRFVSPPERHDGKKRIKVRVEFSEPVEESPENVGAHGVEVEGGEVTSVSPVGGDAPGGAGTRSVGGRDAGQQDREVVWEFEIEPDSDGDLTISLDAGRPCGEPGAICTADGRSLSEGISTTVEGPDTGPPPLTASFEDMPEAHDGESVFRFRVAFSEAIGISYRSLREDAFTVTGGRVTRGKRVDDRRDLFEMTVEPDGAGEVTVTLPAGRECGISGAICTKGENRRQLTNTPTATVAGPAVETGPAGLTARFVDMPSEHRGEGGFRFQVAFSEDIGISYRSLREDAFAVSGGRVTGGKRVDGRRDRFEMTVRPESFADVRIALAAGRDCAVSGAICTKGEPRRRLTNALSATVRGPVAVSVADARAREGEDETIDFAVSLSRAASGQVSVTYATADGTATAGEDYTRASGKLRFAPGETEKQVRVPVLDDVVDEGEETFTLRLLNASGAVVADGEATGTIVNSDPLQKMWLSRFGRTVASQVVDAVTGRLLGPPGGSRVTLGGRSIDLSAPSAGTGGARRTLAGARPPSHLIECGQNPRISPRRFCVRSPGVARAANDVEPPAGSGSWEAARADSWEDPAAGHGSARTLTGWELLLGSSFHLTTSGGEAGGPALAAWGRVTVGGFDAQAPADNGTMRLDGEVTTGILGADAQWERWLAGVALSVSEGKGTFDQPGVDSGTVESTLTSVNPYVRYEASDRLTAWGLLGYGTGDMTIRGNSPVRTDLMMRLGAVGARGVLLEAGEDGGIDLALRGDAFLVQMESEAAENSVETKADASRLRLVLEAGRSFALGEGAVLAPALELGLRHDGGDAETGTGVEVGGRIRYADAGSGLTVEANARTLVAHEDSGYREWGAGGSVRLGPDASGRGLSLALAPVWGTPSSGVDRLWSARDAAGLAPGGEFEAERRLEGEVGYGFGAFGGRGVVTPYAGFGLAEAGDRTWRAGARWSLASHLAMSLDATRREPANDDAPEHAGQFRLILRW